MLLHQQLTGQLIGVYYKVYNGTARTYPEFIYERAMQHELQALAVPCKRQPEYRILYKERLVGVQQLDLFVAGDVVAELKVAPRLTPLHKAQALSYLNVVGKEIGLLFNFGGEAPEFQRLRYFQRSAIQRPGGPQVSVPPQFLSPELTHEVIGSLYEVHTILGPGFVHRIYANAAYHELSLRGLPVHLHRHYEVIYQGHAVGEIAFKHLQIGDSLLLFPIAIQNMANISINNLKAWMRSRSIPLGIVANFNPPQLEFLVLRC